MKTRALGITRKIDHLGRIVIPMEVRKAQKWDEGTMMEMFMSDEGLIMRPYDLGTGKEDIVQELEAVKSATENPNLQRAYEVVIRHLKGARK